VHLTKEQLDAAVKNAKVEYLKDQYGSLLEKTLTVWKKYTNTIDQINDDMNNSRISVKEYQTVVNNLNKNLRDQLGLGKTKEELLDEHIEMAKLLDRAYKQGVISFEEKTAKWQEEMEKWDPSIPFVSFSPGYSSATSAKKDSQSLRRSICGGANQISPNR